VKLNDRPLYTDEYTDPALFMPEPKSSYVFGVTSEKRSEFALQLQGRATDVEFVELREADRFVVETGSDEPLRIPLRRKSVIAEFVKSIKGSPVYLDITGLSHSTWAPIVRVCLELGRDLRVVYLEPKAYTRNEAPRPGEVFDLSEKTEGIEPIPLFAKLDDGPDEKICFVPLLGFEGARFAHMLEEVQPPKRKTFPVIGIPGFQPQYPFDAMLGNAGALERSGANRQIRYAKSNCPFSLYYLLEEIAGANQTDQLKLGLIGTKPHALGAILFAIRNPQSIEIVYDHVKRKTGRTTGMSHCLIFGVSAFFNRADTSVVV
jgi:hypothetical protein